MAKRGPTDTDDHPIPPAEGGYEVVTADGERKPASLPQLAKRMADGVRNLTSMTDEQPTWPAQLNDDAPSLLVPATNGDPGQSDETPQALQLASRAQHKSNVARVADQADRRVAQVVVLDEHGRNRAYDAGRLVALLACWNEAIAQLQNDGWANVTPALIGEFDREIAGWKADRGITP